MSDAASCLNCGATLTGPYCASCGQKQVQKDLTLSEFVHETTQELTHWEGKVPATLKALFLQPGRLTQDFLAGRRARWLPPLRLYLICSIAYFLSGVAAERVTHRSERELARLTVTKSDGRLGLTTEGQQVLDEMPVARIFGRDRVERAVLNNAQFSRAVDSAYAKAMFVLLPLFALLTSVAWRRQMPRYPAHLYLALHLHAAWFAAIALMTIATMFTSSSTILRTAGVVALAYIIWYGLVGLRRVFGESWTRTLVKATAIGIVYAGSLYAASIIILGYAIVVA